MNNLLKAHTLEPTLRGGELAAEAAWTQGEAIRQTCQRRDHTVVSASEYRSACGPRKTICVVLTPISGDPSPGVDE